VIDQRPFPTHDPIVYPAAGPKKKASTEQKDSQIKEKSVAKPMKAPKPQFEPFSLAESKPAQATSFEHEFFLECAHARKVTVAGEFNGWQ
jgi:hypothetical protein